MKDEVNNTKEYKSEYSKKLLKLDQNLKKQKLIFEEKKVNLQDDIDMRKKKISIIEIEVREYKNRFNSLTKNQKDYYLDILMNGVDVRYLLILIINLYRDKGLIWVVRRLIEIDTQFQYWNFPKILDNQQVDYLMKVTTQLFKMI